MAAVPSRKLATFEDLLAAKEDLRLEVIHGSLVEKAAPSGKHGVAQAGLTGQLWPGFNNRGGHGAPGGWWILTEADVELERHEVYRPDLSGWRRERVPDAPLDRPIRVRPDWVCEVLSPSNAKNDLHDKFQVFQRCKVPHYWIVNPDERLLTVYRWTQEGYLVALTATRGEVVRAEPFEAVELRVGLLFGEEE